jgi:hypothetical protein
MTDTERIDWLAAEDTRLEDVRYRMANEEETLREAVDALASMDERMNQRRSKSKWAAARSLLQRS